VVVREELADLVLNLDEVPELGRLLADREVDTTAKIDVLAKVLAGSNVLVRNVAMLLAEKGRAGEIGEVHDEFEALLGDEERVLTVEVTTAEELTDVEFAAITADIERKSGRKVQASRSVEPGLIGGIVLQAGSMRLDASLRGQFDRLRQELGAGR
jgi:F-type H+-transporting ATPase subunit delta